MTHQPKALKTKPGIEPVRQNKTLEKQKSFLSEKSNYTCPYTLWDLIKFTCFDFRNSPLESNLRNNKYGKSTKYAPKRIEYTILHYVVIKCLYLWTKESGLI